MHVVVLTGAGISADSGLKTFRDADGLWEGHRVEDVATPEAWERNPGLVLQFYNERRRSMHSVQPNAAHFALAELERKHKVSIITQNVDNLHERAGSTSVLHLHGELDLARSTLDETIILPLDGRDISLGDKCPRGGQLRPHIVWFGEGVPLISEAAEIVGTADQFLIIGTSLAVYPAAGLIYSVPAGTPVTLIDPAPASAAVRARHIQKRAAIGVPEFIEELSTVS